MHSVSLYSLRTYDHNKKYSDGSHYPPLDDVYGKDLVDIFKEYLDTLVRDDFDVIPDDKSVMSCEPYSVSSYGRCIWGVMNTGIYGEKGLIKNHSTGDLKYRKSAEDADIKERFYLLFCPPGKNEAILVLHSINGDGIKGILHKKLSGLFRSKTKLVLQAHPLTYGKAVEKWQEGSVKEIRAIGFKGFSDRADTINKMGHSQSILVFKPPRNKTFGPLKNIFKGDRKGAVELLSEESSDLKAVVDFEGKKRVFRIGGHGSSPVFRLELDDVVSIHDGVPDFQEMCEWVVGVVNDICKSIYPGQKVEICLAK